MLDIRLAHYDDKKEKWQSHEAYIGYKDDYDKICELDIDNTIFLRGYGESEEEAIAELREKFNKFYDALTKFKTAFDEGSVKLNEVNYSGKLVDDKSMQSSS